MGRTIGSKNKVKSVAPPTLNMSTEERIAFIANLIVEQLEAEFAQTQQTSKAKEVEHANS